MESIRVRGEWLHVDVRGELELFEWHRATWKGDKLIAASPFRADNTPSFFVRLEAHGDFCAGLWADSGAHGGQYEKGNFVQLLAYLRQESWDDAEAYLLSKYGSSRQRATKLAPPSFSRQNYKPLDLAKSIHVAKSSYLARRGIDPDVQKEARCGKPLLLSATGFTAMPWFNVKGELRNIKYRSTEGKRFFYERDAQPISELVFGADLYLQHAGDLILCEAEIDALSWRCAGFAACAVGGSSISQKQADILKRLPCASIIIAGDNDAAGTKLAKRAQQLLRGKPLKIIDYMDLTEKDANEILTTHGSQKLASLACRPIPPTVILQ